MSLYPSPPGLRIPYDRDGSVMAVDYVGNGSAIIDPATMRLANDEANDHPANLNFNNLNGYWRVTFNKLWDLTGYYLQFRSDRGWTILNADSSPDGTSWSTFTSGFSWDWGDNLTAGNSRSLIAGVSLAGTKGIRFYWNTTGGNSAYFVTLHLYGFPSASQIGGSLTELWPWKPDGSAIADGSTGDYGDPVRGVQYTKQARFRNVHGSLTARNVLVAGDVLTNPSPSLLGQFQYSLDTLNWYSVLPIGDVGPGALSPVIYIRNAVSGSAAVGPYVIRAVPSAAGWS